MLALLLCGGTLPELTLLASLPPCCVCPQIWRHSVLVLTHAQIPLPDRRPFDEFVDDRAKPLKDLLRSEGRLGKKEEVSSCAVRWSSAHGVKMNARGRSRSVWLGYEVVLGVWWSRKRKGKKVKTQERRKEAMSR